MKSFRFICLFLTIAVQVASIGTPTKATASKSQNIRVRRIKFCQTCHLDTHYNVDSIKCPFNPDNPDKKTCNSCSRTGHSNKRFHLCPNNPRNQSLNDLLNEEESRPRQCSDCGGDDHINKNSNLCSLNISGINYSKQASSCK